MKLGKDTGSVFNWIYGSKTSPPVVGKGATELHWTDRTAYFVDSVSPDGRECTIERAKAVPKFQGQTDSQSYDYIRDENPALKVLRFRYGSWFEKHFSPEDDRVRYTKIRISFGHMDEYYDPSF